MRKYIAIGALTILVILLPFASAGSTPATKHVDGTVKVYEPTYDREWLSWFEVRTTSGNVDFGYLELYGITPDNNLGQIHEFIVKSVEYYRTSSGSPGARLHMEECIIDPPTPCFESDYEVSDGRPDTFLGNIGWEVESGNISIYTTGGQNQQ